MSLLDVSELKPLVPSPLSDDELDILIERVETQITAVIGEPYSDASTTISETHAGYSRSLYLKRPISSVSTLTEYQALTDTTGTVLTEGETFYVWPDQGRIERLGASKFGARVIVAYVPRDDREKRKQVIIDLVRLYVSRTGLKQESLTGAFAYTAPENWDAEVQRACRRLRFKAV